MCGIAGYYLFSKETSGDGLIKRMTDSLHHRGPDDFGYICINKRDGSFYTSTDSIDYSFRHNLALGNRRLRIIDLSPSGHQPMWSADRETVVVFNGEIYNYIELGKELESLGAVFRSHSDTEVILHAYARWGEDCLLKLNGMWSLALYDFKRESLLLSRDRMGVKPFYYYSDTDKLVFGSEIKAIHEFPGIEKLINHSKIVNYIGRGYRFVDGRDDSFFKGILQLPAASWMKLSRDGITSEKFWDVPISSSPVDFSYDEAKSKLKSLFIDSVRLRLRSDVPYAFCLSGGMDSSSIVCSAAKELGEKTSVFTACYDEKPFDEREYVEELVDWVGADPHYIYPDPCKMLDTLPVMIHYYDEPVPTVTWYSHFELMREVREAGFVVLLNGHGGDELLAGYYDHFLYYFCELQRMGEYSLLEHELACWSANHGKDPEQFRSFMESLKCEPLQDPWRRKYERVFSGEFLEKYAEEEHRIDRFSGFLENACYNELVRETVPTCLRADDRNSSAFSLEARLPFLDYRLVEFCFSLPPSFKIRDGVGKYILRDAMSAIVPDRIRLRKEKVGFNAPSYKWFRNEIKEEIESVIDSLLNLLPGAFNEKRLRAFVDEHLSGIQNHYQFIWNLLNLDRWLKMVGGKSCH